MRRLAQQGYRRNRPQYTRIAPGPAAPPPVQAITGVQQFGVEAVPATLGVIRGTQGLDVQAVGGTVSFDPLGWKNILTAAGVTVHEYYQGDVGITKTGSTLNSWADQSGNTRNITAVGAPSVNTTGLNGRGTVLCNGTADGLDSATDPSAPGTSPSWFYIVCKQITWVAGDRLMGGNGTTFRVVQQSSSPLLQSGNTALTGETPSMTLNTWMRVDMLFAASANATTGDYLRAGNSTITRGASRGNSDPTGLSYAMADGGALFGNFEFALIIRCASEPSGTIITALDALTTSSSGGYGSGVVV